MVGIIDKFGGWLNSGSRSLYSKEVGESFNDRVSRLQQETNDSLIKNDGEYLISKEEAAEKMAKLNAAKKQQESAQPFTKTMFSTDGNVYTVEKSQNTSYGGESFYVVDGQVSDGRTTIIDKNIIKNPEQISHINGGWVNNHNTIGFRLSKDDKGDGLTAGKIAVLPDGTIKTDEVINAQSQEALNDGIQEELGFEAARAPEYGYPQESLETKNEEPEIETENVENHISIKEIITTDFTDNYYFGTSYDKETAMNLFRKEIENGNINKLGKKTDGRVSLNVIPIDNFNNILIKGNVEERINYVLGNKGFLHDMLYNTYGLVFPYTPTFSMSHQVNYDSTDISHSNLSIQNYKNTPVSSISIDAEFTADTEENAKYMLASIWFLRSCTKMDFGEKAKNPGLPPPILYLNGFGNFINNIPVVLTNFSINFPKDKQYISIIVNEHEQWLPTILHMNITLQIQPNIEKYKDQFSLDEYKKGILGGLYDPLFDNSNDIEEDDINNGLYNSGLKKTVSVKLIKEGTKTEEYLDGKLIDSSETIKNTKTDLFDGYDMKIYSGSGWTW